MTLSIKRIERNTPLQNTSLRQTLQSARHQLKPRVSCHQKKYSLNHSPRLHTLVIALLCYGTLEIVVILLFFWPWYFIPRVWDIKRSVWCLEWLQWGLGNCESVRQADCVETLDCRDYYCYYYYYYFTLVVYSQKLIIVMLHEVARTLYIVNEKCLLIHVCCSCFCLTICILSI